MPKMPNNAGQMPWANARPEKMPCFFYNAMCNLRELRKLRTGLLHLGLWEISEEKFLQEISREISKQNFVKSLSH